VVIRIQNTSASFSKKWNGQIELPFKRHTAEKPKDLPPSRYLERIDREHGEIREKSSYASDI
jgi:hypothetical protein